MGEDSRTSRKTAITLYRRLVANDPTRPALTFYDDATGERAELSGLTLDNWTAKTANLLVDGLGFAGGEVAACRLPPHWQSAAILLGCWSAGLAVSPVLAADTSCAADVDFAALQAVQDGYIGSSDDRYVLGLSPLGQPLTDVPAGWLDYISEVRGHGDRYPGALPEPGDAAWVDGDGGSLSHLALVEESTERAASLGIPASGRVLVDGDAFPDPRDWLLAPLAAGASTVIVVGAGESRLATIAQSERVTTVLQR